MRKLLLELKKKLPFKNQVVATLVRDLERVKEQRAPIVVNVVELAR